MLQVTVDTMAEWDGVLDDILGLVLEKVKPQDVASMRSVSRAWRAKADSLLYTLQLKHSQYIPELPHRFKACPPVPAPFAVIICQSAHSV
jgi:hypothetical protein